MRIEYKLGAVLGSLVVVVAAWYFFSRENEPDLVVDTIHSTPEASEVSKPLDASRPEPASAVPGGAPTHAPRSPRARRPAVAAAFDVPRRDADGGSENVPPAVYQSRDDEAQWAGQPDASDEETWNEVADASAPRANQQLTLPEFTIGDRPDRSGEPADHEARESAQPANSETALRVAFGETTTPAQAEADSSPARAPGRRTSRERTAPPLLGATAPAISLERATKTPEPQDSRREATPTRNGQAKRAIEYVIRPNDSLAMLSEVHYGSQRFVRALLDANPEISNPNRILVGQKIIIPPASAVLTASPSAKREAAAHRASTVETSTDSPTYRVRRGETLYELASRWYGAGSRWRDLLELNRDLIGGDGHNLRAGQLIRKPEKH